MTRTDIHRPSQIMPQEYDLVLCYSLATTMDGWPIPSINVNCALIRDSDGKGASHREDGHCCVIGLLHVAKVKTAAKFAPGTCSICGTYHIYGDVWVHRPTGEYITVGHICADKYQLLADRAGWELENAKVRKNAARDRLRHEKEMERKAFLEDHPGLEEALKTQHYIVEDIASRFHSSAYLSDKQVALVMKLHKESKQEIAPEAHVDAPEGKTTFQGRIVSVKARDSQWGVSFKMTVKVETPEGSWLAWGTCPAAILNEGTTDSLKDALVEVKATLKRGNDKHFALMSRPSGKVLEMPEKEEGDVHA